MSCSNGVCSGAPAVQLSGGVAVPGWGGQFNVDDTFTTVAVPFAIRMYSTTTSTVSITTNGVSILSSSVSSCHAITIAEVYDDTG